MFFNIKYLVLRLETAKNGQIQDLGVKIVTHICACVVFVLTLLRVR